MTMPSRILAVSVLLCSAVVSCAGGPAFVAGSGYNPGVEGQALIWANGSVQYFTDQGDLSPILTGAQADALVASAFSAWTTIPGVSLTASQAGHLAEDVNGSNIQTNGFGVVTGPADITSSATSTPVGIVYDYDGTVTDAILGEGAGDLADCFTNAVCGGPDNFSMGGNIAHALIVINGICAATNSQLPDVQYRLVRVLGQASGLGWSQANLNVLTRKPVPTSDDYAGFPVMHFIDPISCVPITICYPNAAVPKMDDMDSLARLYPSGTNPQPSGRVYGTVYFTDASGNAVQPMQGVNVLARLMVSGQPSRQYVATSVSGFSFCGNAGNIIDGYLDANGLPYSRWGSSDPSLEGFFDLGQLMIPTGQTIAQYQLTVEALDPYWSQGVESYTPTQVIPSGSFAPVVVTVTSGSNAERDILMLQDEIAQSHPGSGSTYANPAPLPQRGGWGSWISGYGSTDFFQFTAQINRTASIAVTALDENSQPTETKLLPVIGIWELSDSGGGPAPSSTSVPFNSATFGMSRLDAQFAVSETFRVAVADFRGDGRPDYFYHAHLLYSDTVSPPRLSLVGGATTLVGIGFSPGLRLTIFPGLQAIAGGNNASTLSASASQIQLAAPASAQDGVATIQVTDPVSGSFSQMIGALTYGAAGTDLLLMLQGSEPSTPVGSAAANAIRVRAVAADRVTPVSGATIAWSSTAGLQFSSCAGASSCSVLSNEAGESYSFVTPTATGPATITIALAPASYQPPQSQQATVVGTSSTLDLAAVTPTRWVGQGASLTLPLTVQALDLGAPTPNVKVNFTLIKGTATLSSGSATTNGSGFASITAQVANLSSNVQVTACVAPTNSPCTTFTLFSTPASLWTLETVSASSQIVPTGQTFQPLVMRVTDGSTAANPVIGVNVTFATTLARVPQGQGVPIILGSSQSQTVTAQDGTASIVPSAENVGPCAVFITVTAGTATAQLQMENLALIVPDQPQPANPTPRGPSQLHFGEQPSASQDATVPLFVVPEVSPIEAAASEAAPGEVPPSNESPSGSHLSACPESDAESPVSINDAFGAQPDGASPNVAASDNSDSTGCGKSRPAPAIAPKKEIPSGGGGGNAAAPTVPVSTDAVTKIRPDPIPSRWLPEDKHSCRELAKDGVLVLP